MKMPVLLIVDDEKPTRDALRMGFQDDYEVYTAANLSQASALLQEESPDLVLTDLRLGGESGMDVLKAAASLPHPPQSIMMTAYGSVGLSVGVTPLMNPFARVVTMLTMFIGRVGPVSLAISLSARKDSAAARRAVQPQAHINVG